MKSTGQIKENVLAALEAALPAVLATAGLDDFADYVNGPPSNAAVKQCSVYVAPATYSEDFIEREVLVQMALPGEMGPEEYMDATEPTLFALDAHRIAGATNKRYGVTPWYPNELESGQSAFVLFSLKYTEELDSCDIY